MRPPLDEYAARKRDREAAAAARERTHVHLGNAKVAIFIAHADLHRLRDWRRSVAGDLSAIGVALFIALSIWHEVVMRALARAQAAVTYYADGEARIEDRWMRDTPSGERFRDRDHPYADDLDVFGPAQPVSVAVVVPDADGRGAAGRLAAAPVADSRASASASRASRHCAAASICASASPSSMPDAGDRFTPIG